MGWGILPITVEHPPGTLPCSVPSRYLILVPITPEGSSPWSQSPHDQQVPRPSYHFPVLVQVPSLHPYPHQVLFPAAITLSPSSSPHHGPHYLVPIPSRYLVLVPITLSPTAILSRSHHPIPVAITLFPCPAGSSSQLPLSCPQQVPRPGPHHPVPNRYFVQVPSSRPCPHQVLCPSPHRLVPITTSQSTSGTSSQSPSPCPHP